MTCCSVLKLLGIDFDLNFLAYFIFYVTRRRRTPAFLVPGHGGKSFVGVVISQRYKYRSSSSSTFTAVHILLRYGSTVNAVGGPFYFRSQSVRQGSPFVINTAIP